MKKTLLRIMSYVLVAALTAVIVLLAEYVLLDHKLLKLQNLLSECYIGETDEKAISDAAARSMVNALGDRWSHYMSAEEYQSYQDSMSNSFVGIGVTIVQREDGQGVDVEQVTAGGPAQAAGIAPGDCLTAVAGKSIAGMTTSEVAALVRGKEGTSIELRLLRQGEEITVNVLRRRIQTAVASAVMLEDQIGLITIENFDGRCASETLAAIGKMRQQGARALIFDVRNNPGGYKDEMVQVLDYLLPAGPLFRSEDYEGNVLVAESDEKYLDMPMAVLVNLQSYSAAEFFAAALSEYDAAVVVGEKTFGKGYFQNTYELGDGSAVTLSVGKYTTPKGVSLAGVGLTPDVEVPVDDETAAKIYADLLEPGDDPQIQAAVNALKKP